MHHSKDVPGSYKSHATTEMPEDQRHDTSISEIGMDYTKNAYPGYMMGSMELDKAVAAHKKKKS